MITLARWPATSTYPRSRLGLLEFTSLRMTLAGAFIHGLPPTKPPSWVCTAVRLLFRMTPLRWTSNWL
jgi:hypothetical protein